MKCNFGVIPLQLLAKPSEARGSEQVAICGQSPVARDEAEKGS